MHDSDPLGDNINLIVMLMFLIKRLLINYKAINDAWNDNLDKDCCLKQVIYYKITKQQLGNP